jgi:hypothetical protein
VSVAITIARQRFAGDDATPVDTGVGKLIIARAGSDTKGKK